MLNTILIITLSFLTFSFALSYIAVNKKLTETKQLLVSALAINLDLNKELITLTSDEQKIHNDNFLKFLSDSREWAFQYIENVQKELKNFSEILDPEIKYFDEFGIVGSSYPHYESMKKISEAYKKLQTIMVEETK